MENEMCQGCDQTDPDLCHCYDEGEDLTLENITVERALQIVWKESERRHQDTLGCKWDKGGCYHCTALKKIQANFPITLGGEDFRQLA